MRKRTKADSFQWDGRGVSLLSLAASWISKATALEWQQFIECVPLQPEPWQEGSDAFPAASCLAMTGPEKGSRRMQLAVHDGSHEKANRPTTRDSVVEAHWRLEVWLAPKDASPEAVSRSESAGGYSGVLEKMAQHWPASGPLKLRASASYVLNPVIHKMHSSLDILDTTPVKIKGKTLVPGAVLWESRGADDSYITITYPSPERKTIGFSWSGPLECELDTDLVGRLDGLIWEFLVPLVPRSTR